MIIKNKGFVLVEIIIYSVGVVLLIGAIVFMLVNVYGWYNQITIVSKTDQVGTALVDRIIRDIRTAESINDGQSSFGVDSGYLTINSQINSVLVVKYYGLSQGKVVYKEGVQDTLPVSSMVASTTKLIFKKIDTPVSKAIRVELELTFLQKGVSTSRSYSGLAIMRNSY